jgi:chromate reductase
MKKILAISGSLREKSFNTGLAKALQALVPEGVVVEHATISSLPFFNEDIESVFPEEATVLKNQIEEADAVVFATPEYNRSIPGVLKNAIDWASRPWGKNSFTKKPVLIMGASTGPIATAVAQQELKKIMLYLDAKLVGQPELYIGTAGDKFNEAGELTDENTKEHIKKALGVLVASM